MVSILLAMAIGVPTPSPTISPLPPAIVQWYARRGADVSGLDAALIRAVIDAESGGDPNAVSKAGAIGLMQLQPATAGDCGLRDAFDPRGNVECGARTLGYLVHRYGVQTGIAAYNFGPGSVDAVGGHLSKMPLETQDYVKSVVDGYDARQHEELPAQAPAPPAPRPSATPRCVAPGWDGLAALLVYCGGCDLSSTPASPQSAGAAPLWTTMACGVDAGCGTSTLRALTPPQPPLAFAPLECYD